MIDELYDKLNQYFNNTVFLKLLLCDHTTDKKQFFFLHINDIFI